VGSDRLSDVDNMDMFIWAITTSVGLIALVASVATVIVVAAITLAWMFS